MIEDAARAVGIALADNLELVLLGETRGHLGQSLWLREIAGREEGPPPPVDLQAERRTGDFVRGQIAAGTILACHDVSDGGLLVAVAEMAMEGGVGVHLLSPAPGLPAHAFWFGEDQGRYVVAASASGLARILKEAAEARVPSTRLGRSGGGDLTLPGQPPISLRRLTEAHRRFLPALMDT
jgi:phosphoribosylformylglycinamidine synthase